MHVIQKKTTIYKILPHFHLYCCRKFWIINPATCSKLWRAIVSVVGCPTVALLRYCWCGGLSHRSTIKILWSTSAYMRVIFEPWFLHTTDECIGHWSHCHFFFNKYLTLTILETKSVSNKKNNRSVQRDDKNNNNDVLNQLSQNSVLGYDDIGSQLTLPFFLVTNKRANQDFHWWQIVTLTVWTLTTKRNGSIIKGICTISSQWFWNSHIHSTLWLASFKSTIIFNIGATTLCNWCRACSLIAWRISRKWPIIIKRLNTKGHTRSTCH